MSLSWSIRLMVRTIACHAINASSILAWTVAHLVTVMNVISVSRNKKHVRLRRRPTVAWFNSMPCYCLSMREVNHVMLALPIALMPIVLTYVVVFHFDS